jgi:arylsulfatase A-like enzyme
VSKGIEKVPNVVLVHCHDLGRWLPVYGRFGVVAPNLSALAMQSLVFESTFSTSPLCTPARSSIFTGLSPHENGLMGLTHQGWTYLPGVVTLPEHLNGLGVRTALIGLQHEDFDARKLGFDEVHGFGFIPRALAVAGSFERWIEQRDNSTFFASVGMWEAHRPWPSEDYESFDPSSVDVPGYLPDNLHTRQDLADFYGAIKQLDEAVGRIVEAIDGSRFRDNTVIIFTTDHGAAFPRAKGTLFDSGVEASLIVRPVSHLREARRISVMTSHLDLAPTILELQGGDPDTIGGAGKSFAPLIKGEAKNTQGHKRLFFEKTFHDSYDPLRGVRTERYKYIRRFTSEVIASMALDLELSKTRLGLPKNYTESGPQEQLYDVVADPSEVSNLASKEEFQITLNTMRIMLNDWMIETDDPLLRGVVLAPEAPKRQ